MRFTQQTLIAAAATAAIFASAGAVMAHATLVKGDQKFPYGSF